MQGNVLFQSDYNQGNNEDLQFYQTTYNEAVPNHQSRQATSTYAYSTTTSSRVDYGPPGAVTWESIRSAFGTGAYPGEPSLLEGTFRWHGVVAVVGLD